MALAALCVLAGCSNKTRLAAVRNEGPLSSSVLSARAEEFKALDDPPYSPNGYVCLTNGLLGVGFQLDQRAEDAGSDNFTLFLANRFTRTGTESLVQFGNPFGLPTSSQPFRDEVASLDLETGVYSVRARHGGHDVYYEFVLSPSSPSAVERWTIKGQPGQRAELDVEKVPRSLSSQGEVDSGPAVKAVVAVDGDDQAQMDGPSVKAVIGQSGVVRVTRKVAFGAESRLPSFEETAQAAKEWASGRDAPRVIIDGPADDQRFVASALYFLRCGVNPSGPTGPFGVTNPKYGGRQFWDADTWMFPVLALCEPKRAAAIPLFRLATAPAAFTQALDWIAEKGVLYHPAPGERIYKYPWEAGPTGKENAPEASAKQHHITADVALMAEHASALGLIDPVASGKLVRGCANWLWRRSSRLESGEWGILDTMSPDEFHTGDNDLYTNIATEQALKAAYPSDWKNRRFKRPRDSTTFLTYDNDGLRAYKQAAALLAIWPLQDPDCEAEAGAMLKRFAGKTAKNGPAMSKSVEALVRARFGDVEVAYQEWRTSWQLYTKRPLMQFSEAPNGKNATFLTGVAGCLDAFLYGFVGFRIDKREPPAGAKWKTPIKNGYWLSITPKLPKAWPSVKLQNFSVLGRKVDFTITNSAVTVSPMQAPPSNKAGK
ncbi:MAG: hypothetical protein JSS66_01360 [Armatimonadetes bacterium]|nr:hypothetical protein [Armatimonadota bacterium]